MVAVAAFIPTANLPTVTRWLSLVGGFRLPDTVDLRGPKGK